MFKVIVGHLDGETEFFECDTREEAIKVADAKLDETSVVYVEIEKWA